jgi:hypothetical protein
MTILQKISWGYVVALGFAALLNYIPGVQDEQGRCFGIFELDIGDDILHLSSAAWAGLAAWTSHRASSIFLGAFGSFYLLDGLMGLVTGSGYLDAGIIQYGFQVLPLMFKVYANTPHIVLGGVALVSAFLFGRMKQA